MKCEYCKNGLRLGDRRCDSCGAPVPLSDIPMIHEPESAEVLRQKYLDARRVYARVAGSCASSGMW